MCPTKNRLTMKELFRFTAVVLGVALMLVGCDDTLNSPSDKGALPTIKIEEHKSTSTSISFRVMAIDATECAYMLYTDGELSAERILSAGVAIKGDGTKTVVEGLSPETTYYAVAAARNSRGAVMSNMIPLTTTKKEEPQKPIIPDDPDARTLEIEKSTDGRWYANDNYYVTLVATTGERLILDFYTISETMSSYLPYGSYTVASDTNAYTICADSSGIILNPEDSAEDGYLFTEGTVSIDVVEGMYALYFYLSYEADGVTHTVDGYYNGHLSGATVPAGDDSGAKKLIEILDVGATSFQFRINAEAGQYWRCSVVDKRVYDQTESNPGAWVVTSGFMLDGTRTFNWENGKECEHVPGLKMVVTSSTDYLILAALMDYSEGREDVLLGGVEVVQLRTEGEATGKGSVEIDIKEINANDILFDCTMSEDVWCCYVAMMETANLEEIKAGRYELVGYETYEECMLSLIPGLSHDFMRQFLTSQVDYRWEYLKYNTSYTICIKVVDMDNGVSFIELEPFTTM